MPGRWSWTDAAIFIGVFTVMRVVFIGLAARAIVALVPDHTTCETCGDATDALRLEGAWRVFAWRPIARRIQRRFCLGCGWVGFVRRPVAPAPPRAAASPARRDVPSGASHEG